MKHRYPVALVILDGFGFSPETPSSAIHRSSMPFFYSLLEQYPWTLLQASGKAVGLPEGTIGNSEVGHMTIGLGTTIEQPLTKLNTAITEGTLLSNPQLMQDLSTLKKNHGSLHLMGLFSDSGVHSTLQHLYAYLAAANKAGITKIYIHAFLDGRDTLPQTAASFLEQLDQYCTKHPHVHLASLQGRYYAMDRDEQWDLTGTAYDLLTQKPERVVSWQEALETTYNQGLTEEFAPPTALCNDGFIKPGDGIIFFNFRADRARQLTALFIGKKRLPGIDPLRLTFFITPVSYGQDYTTDVLFDFGQRPPSLIDRLEQKGYTTLSVAETTKYAHITYFFNGGRETQHAHEERILIPSYPPNTLRQHPCMKAPEITATVVASLQKKPCDFYLMNYANADMVGHTGDIHLTEQSLLCLDSELKKFYTAVVNKAHGVLLITGDHGNAECMVDPVTGKPHTAHTTNPVYFLTIDAHKTHILTGMKELKDIAPFILHQFFS